MVWLLSHESQSRTCSCHSLYFCTLYSLYPGIKPGSPALLADSLPTQLSKKPHCTFRCDKRCSPTDGSHYGRRNVCSLHFIVIAIQRQKSQKTFLQNQISISVQFSHSVVSDSVTPRTAACQASLSVTNSQSLPKLLSIESVMPSNHLILCHPLLLLPSIFPSIRVFSNESALHIRWPKY